MTVQKWKERIMHESSQHREEFERTHSALDWLCQCSLPSLFRWFNTVCVSIYE